MTAEQLAALQARLAQADTVALSFDAAAERLNTPGTGTGTVWLDVSPESLKQRLLIDACPAASAASLSVWGLVKLNSRRVPSTAWASAEDTPNAQDQMVSHMVALVDLLEAPLVEASNSEMRARFQAIFAALVGGGWMASATRDTCVNLVSRSSSWGEDAPFLRKVTARDVGIARGGQP